MRYAGFGGLVLGATLAACGESDAVGAREALCTEPLSGVSRPGDGIDVRWAEMPVQIHLEETCRYFAARRGTCGSYQWMEFATGGLGDKTELYFDASGKLVAEK